MDEGKLVYRLSAIVLICVAVDMLPGSDQPYIPHVEDTIWREFRH
jgi:hypothetical protein